MSNGEGMGEGEVKVLRTGTGGSGSATGLDILDLSSLIQALASNRRTGTLKVTAEVGQEGYVYFQEGVLRLVNSPAPGSSTLEDALLKLKLLSREEVEGFRANARSVGRTPAELIIADGRFETNRLKNLLIRQVTDRAADLLAWKSTHCEFFPGRITDDSLDPTLAAFSPGVIADGIMLEAARRDDEWERIRQVFDPAADVFEMVPERPRVEAKDIWAALASLIDGYRDVAEIAAASTLSAFETCRGLLDMIENGLVRTKGADELVAMGEGAVSRSEWAKAVKLFRRAHTLEESRSELLLKMAAACEAMGDVSGARANLKIFVTKSTDLGQFGEAAAACRRLVALDPENAEPRAALFRLLLELKEHAELRTCGLELAALYEKERALEPANELLAKLRELFPDDQDVAELAARVHLATAERTEAVVEYEQLAENYLARGDIENAIRTFRKIVEDLDEECLEARIQLAECLIKLDRTEEAVTEYNKLAAILARTGVLSETSNLPFVIKVNSRIADLDALNTTSREWLAETYATRRDQKKSLAAFDQLLAIHEQLGNRRKLLATLQRIAELFPKELGYRERLAECYLADEGARDKAKAELADICQIAWMQESYEVGRRVAEKLLELDPFYMPAHFVKGEVLLSGGDRPGAARKLFSVAQAFTTAGLIGDAEEVLRAALRIDDDLAEAHHLLAKLLDEDADTAQAAEQYLQAGLLELSDSNYGLAKAALSRVLELNPGNAAAAQMLQQLPPSLRPPRAPQPPPAPRAPQAPQARQAPRVPPAPKA